VIIPSEWVETGPLVFHEAVTCGCDIITSDIGGQKELAELYKGKSYLFKMGDKVSLKNVITGYKRGSAKETYVPMSIEEHYDQISDLIITAVANFR
jgi:hypothetical protein